ncbi:hypothetical protein SPRG_00028 [Saprolegnia parasitica CBS 223.65]|uniref:Uncharacterized protein n=1 Tax=Saprolegnia parasitica (strain CBS 223.65) TaxID=695850 RepID=A0A067D871_SAPPC|nr:hypothetical protein SPRG_00028 [Saprolegnia parasitica CBS 223.65]KDO35182.1 hypothetical protein SPRG_00028 [Saprolegnia parasitica CBS 223.65]|eukprot:XP_012193534.1 hypothetical protein SPRG_00028 [Saprolegnia parasitica CBS 223.65]
MSRLALLLVTLLCAAVHAAIDTCQVCASTGQCDTAYKGLPGKYCGPWLSSGVKQVCCCPTAAVCAIPLQANACLCKSPPPAPAPSSDATPTYVWVLVALAVAGLACFCCCRSTQYASDDSYVAIHSTPQPMYVQQPVYMAPQPVYVDRGQGVGTGMAIGAAAGLIGGMAIGEALADHGDSGYGGGYGDGGGYGGDGATFGGDF